MDPLAEGILPIAIGEATKSIPYLAETKKTYFFEATWGEETTTLDAEGEITSSSKILPSLIDLQKIIKKWIGETEQIPPKYSAKKINGERSYNLSRKKINFQLKKQKIKIYNIRVVKHNGNKTSFVVKCGNGTYIRALIRDIAYALGTYGYASKIVRYRYGQFSKKTSINMVILILDK